MPEPSFQAAYANMASRDVFNRAENANSFVAPGQKHRSQNPPSIEVSIVAAVDRFLSLQCQGEP